MEFDWLLVSFTGSLAGVTDLAAASRHDGAFYTSAIASGAIDLRGTPCSCGGGDACCKGTVTCASFAAPAANAKVGEADEVEFPTAPWVGGGVDIGTLGVGSREYV